MTGTETIRHLVRAFHEAVNGPDAARLVELVTPDVEVGGPRGTGQGAALVADWLGRAGIQLTPRRTFARDSVVVVEQDAAWKDAETGALSAPQAVATVFRIRDGRIAAIVRHESLADALAAAGLDESDALLPEA